MWPVYVILQKKNVYQEFCEKCSLETSSTLFLIFKESLVHANSGGLHADLDIF